MRKFLGDFSISLKKDKKELVYIFVFIVYSMTTFELFNRPLIGPVRNLKIGLDDLIPMVKELIIIYHTYIPMIILVGLILFTYNRKAYLEFVVCLFLAQTSSYVIVTFFQTYVPRYDVNLLGDDIFSRIIRVTYSVDNTYSGLPSLHVCNMILSAKYFIRAGFNKKTNFIMISYLMLVAATTVFVKQHVIVDVPAGIIHAIIFYNVTNYLFEKREK